MTKRNEIRKPAWITSDLFFYALLILIVIGFGSMVLYTLDILVNGYQGGYGDF